MPPPSSNNRDSIMNKAKLAAASLMAIVFLNAYADGVLVEAGGTYTATGSPVQTVTTGPTTANGGLGGTASSTTGAITANGGLGGLGRNSSLSTGDSILSTGASTSQGGQSSSTGNTSGNNSISANYTAARIPVSTSYSPANLPTAPCMGSTSMGLTSVMFGFSSGSSWEATECMILEMARSFSQDGQLEDAQAVRCSSKYAVNAPSCIKLIQQRADNKKLIVNIGIVDNLSELKSIVDTRASPPALIGN
ncbi:MAG: hypothetical protein RJB18_1362 [Pseudomonadota bacterium]